MNDLIGITRVTQIGAMVGVYEQRTLLFGPKKLPQIARQIGKALAEFRRASNEFQWQLQDGMRKLEQEADTRNTVAPVATANIAAVQPRLAQPETSVLPEARAPEAMTVPDVSNQRSTV